VGAKDPYVPFDGGIRAAVHRHPQTLEDIMSPYIPQERRKEIDDQGAEPSNTGELTYLLYRACLDYLPSDPRFADYSEVMAALECAKLEFYRRRVAPYEDTKIAESGDVD
jgi:hypothetical protein